MGEAGVAHALIHDVDLPPIGVQHKGEPRPLQDRKAMGLAGGT